MGAQAEFHLSAAMALPEAHSKAGQVHSQGQVGEPVTLVAEGESMVVVAAAAARPFSRISRTLPPVPPVRLRPTPEHRCSPAEPVTPITPTVSPLVGLEVHQEVMDGWCWSTKRPP